MILAGSQRGGKAIGSRLAILKIENDKFGIM
jgi:hypothetical protein